LVKQVASGVPVYAYGLILSASFRYAQLSSWLLPASNSTKFLKI